MNKFNKRGFQTVIFIAVMNEIILWIYYQSKVSEILVKVKTGDMFKHMDYYNERMNGLNI